MATEPDVSCDPCTVRLAVEDKPVDATRVAEPSDPCADEKITVPVGALPLEFVTVALSVVLPVDCKMVVELAVRLMDVVEPDTLEVDHEVARLYASTDPSPVARS
jgi:hypothetical protein